jgi:hypothetical protein
VANTEGQGANIRAEPSPNAARVKSVRDGTELETLGSDREVEGRAWRNVRDPADGATGWIATELLEGVPSSSPTASRSEPAGPASPVASPAATAAGPADAVQRLGEADRAYLAALQPEVDTLGKAITQATQQMEEASGRPAAFDEQAWRSAVNGAITGFSDAARRIRATSPGPNTGEVHDYAVKAADRAEEAGRLLAQAAETKDTRAFGPTRIALLRVLSEINAMSGVLIRLR